ncbi:hypothetical protein [Oryzifoliimicrobium ureilyticus]|uniref:hypothetical protein n=1 Tax=Oryzifoliimicrobium ureilyticus TaxID=3113724 RepID=UPI0030767D95
MIINLYQGELFADYFQIYLRDSGHPQLPEDYSDEVLARRLMAGPYSIILHTARNMKVPLRVEWHNHKPALNFAAFQHVAEASFACPSGELVLAGMTDAEEAAPHLAVRAGGIGVRANFSGLDTLSEDGLEGSDHYLLQLWPQADMTEIEVLKAYPLS